MDTFEFGLLKVHAPSVSGMTIFVFPTAIGVVEKTGLSVTCDDNYMYMQWY